MKKLSLILITAAIGFGAGIMFSTSAQEIGADFFELPSEIGDTAETEKAKNPPQESNSVPSAAKQQDVEQDFSPQPQTVETVSPALADAADEPESGREMKFAKNGPVQMAPTQGEDSFEALLETLAQSEVDPVIMDIEAQDEPGSGANPETAGPVAIPVNVPQTGPENIFILLFSMLLAGVSIAVRKSSFSIKNN